MAKPFRPNAVVRANNAVMVFLMHRGLHIGSFALLTIRGRKSGKMIETPVAVFEQDGRQYLTTPYGIVNWVRNLRAASGVATITQGRHTETVQATELPAAEAAPIFRAALHAGPPGIPDVFVQIYRRFLVLPYLDVGMDSAPADFEREVLTHPVFRLETPSDTPGGVKP